MTGQQNNNDVLPLQGGSYRQVVDGNKGRGGQTHHIPAWGAYDKSNLLSHNDGSSIWMTPEDHRKTASWGRSKEAGAYRDRQKELIDQGRFEDALQMDVDDLRSKFGNTYDPAIQKAQDYYHNDLEDRLSPAKSELSTDEQTADAQQLTNAQLADQLGENTSPSTLITEGSEVDDNV
jgi:hypothetical protein